jgi:succinate-semialdehyde dehydrogenase / glutarate-semialdehyde dehydrogenase
VQARVLFVSTELLFAFPQVSELVVGEGTQAGVTMGPLISPSALARVHALVTDAVRNGATVSVGGMRLAPQAPRIPDGGNFYAPTVIDMRRAAKGCDISREEIFGPVVPVWPFETEDEVVASCNVGDAGLAAYVYTRDLSRSWRLPERLDVGMVGVNTGIISVSSAPFGGVKQSGFGREGGSAGLAEYLSWKYAMVGV